MCTFEEMISREGEEKAQLKAYVNMKNAAFDDQTICSILGITLQKIRKFKKYSQARQLLLRRPSNQLWHEGDRGA